MTVDSSPKVMILDGEFDTALQVATEVSTDLAATVIGIGNRERSRLLRSKYCDVGVTVPATGAQVRESLIAAIEEHKPDIVVPLGYGSVVTMSSLAPKLPSTVECCLPPLESLRIALDKRKTLAAATELGIDTPTDYTSMVKNIDKSERSGAPDSLPFPVFLKARHECGETVTAIADEPSTFWSTYDALSRRAIRNEVLVQEYIDTSRTYGCGLLFSDGSLRMSFEHVELRSIPRRGGSGTRLRIFRDPDLEATSVKLLKELAWNGLALVEFKRRDDGTYVLMEINPKLWASYALASQSGYRFVSTMAAETLGISWSRNPWPPKRASEMVFPLRELKFAASAGNESIVRSLLAILWPPARWDLNVDDLRAWLTLPSPRGNEEDATGMPVPSPVELGPPNREFVEEES